MKTILFCLFSLLSISAFSQKDYWQINLSGQTTQNDTIPTVVNIQPINTDRYPLYTLNGQQISLSTLNTINPKIIDSINVEKKEIKLNSTTYYGKVSIKMKGGYRPQFVSLNNLKLKYTQIKNEPVIFMLDNEFIKENYDQYIVDQKYILKIIVDKIDMPDNKLQINLIRLLTRNEENIRKSKEIHIRGSEINADLK